MQKISRSGLQCGIYGIGTYLGSEIDQAGISRELHLTELEMGVIAVQQIIHSLDGQLPEIERVIFCTSGIRHLFPAVSIGIARHFGLECEAFDVAAGCAAAGPAFAYAEAAGGFSLIIVSELLSHTVDHSDALQRKIYASFSDGCAAILVGHGNSELPALFNIAQVQSSSRGEFLHYYASSGGKIIRDLPEHKKLELKNAYLDSWHEIVKKLSSGRQKKDIERFYVNQGDISLFELLADRLGIDLSRITRTQHGHAGGADPWIALQKMPLKKGQFGICLGSGIGFAFYGVLIEGAT